MNVSTHGKAIGAQGREREAAFFPTLNTNEVRASPRGKDEYSFQCLRLSGSPLAK